MKIEIQKEINPAKLLDELLIVGLIQAVTEDGTSPIQGNTLYLPDTANTQAIQAVIDAHEPIPNPTPPTAEERLEALELAMLDMVLGGVV